MSKEWLVCEENADGIPYEGYGGYSPYGVRGTGSERYFSCSCSSTCAAKDGSASSNSMSTRTTSVLGTRLPTVRLRWVAQRASSSLRSADRSTVKRSVAGGAADTGAVSSRE